eukprot:TRINITY_DN709_c1_g5_i1.p1 TRINITY_DN709_c1_g5~~TRINITY_DN709_c1_g5_i1.p1  ORF type:complete len:305 (+),score=104.40 TRINITY_DN709_c1_g5_i1:26-916(+)
MAAAAAGAPPAPPTFAPGVKYATHRIAVQKQPDGRLGCTCEGRFIVDVQNGASGLEVGDEMLAIEGAVMHDETDICVDAICRAPAVFEIIVNRPVPDGELTPAAIRHLERDASAKRGASTGGGPAEGLPEPPQHGLPHAGHVSPERPRGAVSPDLARDHQQSPAVYPTLQYPAQVRPLQHATFADLPVDGSGTPLRKPAAKEPRSAPPLATSQASLAAHRKRQQATRQALLAGSPMGQSFGSPWVHQQKHLPWTAVSRVESPTAFAPILTGYDEAGSAPAPDGTPTRTLWDEAQYY